MPRVAIESANSGKGGKGGPYAEPTDTYKPPHERKDGPWDEYDLDSAGRDMERAEQIKGNPKFVEAIAAHHEKKAKHHRKLAQGMKGHMARGLVSDTAMKKAIEGKRRG